MKSIFCLLICFFISNIHAGSAKLNVKRLFLTDTIENREPKNKLELADINNQEFFVFLELSDCDGKSLLLKITTRNGFIDKKFNTKVMKRYRTFYKFKNLSKIQKIEIIDSEGNVLGRSEIKKDSPKSSSEKKITKNDKVSGIKKVLQSMQDEENVKK